MLSHEKIKAGGFTLIELLIVIAIIGILSAVAVPLFDQYRTRGYDAHSKQALLDMSLLYNAYWIDNDSARRHATFLQLKKLLTDSSRTTSL